MRNLFRHRRKTKELDPLRFSHGRKCVLHQTFRGWKNRSRFLYTFENMSQDSFSIYMDHKKNRKSLVEDPKSCGWENAGNLMFFHFALTVPYINRVCGTDQRRKRKMFIECRNMCFDLSITVFWKRFSVSCCECRINSVLSNKCWRLVINYF